MDIGKAFRFVFEDHDWVTKVLIGGVMSLLSPLLIGVFFLAGYSVDLINTTTVLYTVSLSADNGCNTKPSEG